MSSSISILEYFPDELFYEVFEYLSVDDLYDGFYDLNIRFRSILASLTNIYGELIMNHQVQSPAFHFFASRITMLKVNNVNPIDLSPFLAVRSLRLHTEPDRIQCQSIQCLPHLKYLYVSRYSGEHFYYSISLSFFVFTNSFPSLRTCQLNLILFKTDQQWTLVPSLHTLSICVADPRVYSQVLRSCPSLVQFRVEFTEQFFRLPEAYNNPSHSSLRRFELCLNRTTLSCCQIIDLLLSIVPNLTSFFVRGSTSDANNINMDLLAIILRQRLSKLRYFYLEMAVPEFLAIKILDDDGHGARQLHPLFDSIKIYPSTQNAPARLIITSKL